MLKKLKLKFVAITMAIVTVMLLVIFSLVYHSTNAQMDAESARVLQVLTQEIQQGKEGKDVGLPHFTLEITPRGTVRASGNTYYDLSDESFVLELLYKISSANETTGWLDDYNLIYSKASSMGRQLYIFVDTTSQQVALRSLVRSSVAIGIASLAVFFAISFLLAHWAVKPVDKAWHQQRQFISDASHELKTPLTVIMSNAELLQDPEYDEEKRADFSRSILTMSHQMRDLVEGLLELSRADNGQIKKAFTPVNLSDLVTDALLPFEAVMYEKGLQLQSQIAPGVAMKGNGQYLIQLVDILLDNACKYSDPGIVDVTLTRQGRSRCLLTVSNPGTPIPKADLEKIFGRFYRADQARQRTGSFGLGLSIADSVVKEHGGKIWAESNPTGNCFFVQLPCDIA